MRPISTGRTFRLPALLFALLVGSPFTQAIATDSLPLEVRIDMAIVGLERAIDAEDHAATLARIEALRALDPALAAGDLVYFEAMAAQAVGDLDRTEAALDSFLSGVPRESSHYEAALVMKLELPAIREARQAEQRAEDARRQAAEAEAERQARQASAPAVVNRQQPVQSPGGGAGSLTWRVANVPEGDTLNVRSEPFNTAARQAAYPNGRRLEMTGRCTGQVDLRTISGHAAAERQQAVRHQWCEVRHDPAGDGRLVSGWVYGRYIAPL